MIYKGTTPISAVCKGMVQMAAVASGYDVIPMNSVPELPDVPDYWAINYDTTTGKNRTLYFTKESDMRTFISDNSSILTKIKIKTVGIPNLAHCGSLFRECGVLVEIDLSEFDTTNQTTTSGGFGFGSMFYKCCALKKVIFPSNFSIGVGYNVNSMFAYCNSLEEVDLSMLDTSNITNYSYMFKDCSSLKTLDLSNFTSKKIGSVNNMFDGCTSLIELDVRNLDFNDNIYPSTGMFTGHNKDIIVTVKDETSQTFIKRMLGSTGKAVVYMPIENGWKLAYSTTDNSIVMNNFYESFTELKTFISDNKSILVTSTIFTIGKPATTNFSCNSLFKDCTKITRIDLSKFDTSYVNNMGQMFRNCSSLNELNIENFDTSRVTTISYMFGSCSKLTNINFKVFNTEKVTDMSGLFYGCVALTSIDLSNINTSNTSNFQQVFQNCMSLESLDLSKFDTQKASTFYGMFRGCNKLTSLDLSSFYNTKNPSFNGMFYDCSNLIKLDIHNISITKAVASDMFYKHNNNIIIIVRDADSETFIRTVLGETGTIYIYSDRNICDAVEEKLLYYNKDLETNSNVFDNYTIENGTVTVVCEPNESGTMIGALVGFIMPVEPNTTYTVSFVTSMDGAIDLRAYGYTNYPTKLMGSEDYSYLKNQSNTTAGRVSATITTKETNNYMAFGFQSNTDGMVVSQFQVEKGDTLTDYVPYMG